MASGEAAAEPLKYKTLALKVSIHCEGCKRKVKKVLQGIEGVYKTTIDSQQQKVTVTGNVEADTLIKKLLKSGKHAELWPEKKPAGQNATAATAAGGKKNKKKGSGAAPSPAKSDERENSQSASDADNTSAAETAKSDAETQNNSANEAKKATASPPAKPAGDEAEKPSPGGGSKKKGKTLQANAVSGGGAVVEGKQGSQIPVLSYHIPTYSAQPPAYVLSYSTAQPAASYPSAVHHSNYVFSGHQPPAGTHYIPAMPSAPLSSDLFSEENDNACTVM